MCDGNGMMQILQNIQFDRMQGFAEFSCLKTQWTRQNIVEIDDISSVSRHTYIGT